MKKISVEVSKVLDRQIRILAANLDMTRSEFVRVALQEKVKASAQAVDDVMQIPPVTPDQARVVAVSASESCGKYKRNVTGRGKA